MLAFELLTSRLPFSGPTMLATLQNILANRLDLPANLPPLARNFIHCCLQSDCNLRPSVEQLTQHPWLNP